MMDKIPFKSDKPFTNDDLLIDGLLSGDFRSFEKIYNKYVREMYMLSAGYTNDSDEAKDIVQDAFVYLWNNRTYLRPDSNLRNYLRTIIRNASLNSIRNKRIRNKHKKIINTQYEQETICQAETLNSTSATPGLTTETYKETDKEIELKLRHINQKLEQLPHGCKKAFVMSVIEGYTYKQVAEKMGISINTVKTQIKIAYRKIRPT